MAGAARAVASSGGPSRARASSARATTAGAPSKRDGTARRSTAGSGTARATAPVSGTARAAQPQHLGGRPAGSTRQGGGLRVAEPRPDRIRRARRGALVLRGIGVALVLGALVVAAAAHAVVARDQSRLDSLQSQVASALGTEQTLQMSRAELQAPLRVLGIAEHHLKMVAPPSVTYLSPVDPGPSVAEAQAAAAARRASSPGRAGSLSSRPATARRSTLPSAFSTGG